jgi:hypothetical protein
MNGRKISLFQTLGWVGLGFVLAFGSIRAFQGGGGRDFAVFHAAWRAVLAGRGAEIYRVTPDRFLYAPGFAWVLAPLGWIPEPVALALWTLLKVAALAAVLVAFARRLRIGAAGPFAWGVLLFSRPLIIDLQYGQVNAWILFAAVWVLLTFDDPARGAVARAVSWLSFSFLAAAKLFGLPLLLLPFVTRGRRIERAATAAGAACALVPPFFSLGASGTAAILLEWKAALLGKGIPLETHNQSFSAFLHRIPGTSPSPYIPLESHLPFSLGWLDPRSVDLLSLAWAAGVAGILLALVLVRPERRGPAWAALLIGLLVIPSHLVWKPYFIFGIPAALCFVARIRARRELVFATLVFAMINLTGFDLVGYAAAARIEAASGWLFALLGLLVLVGRQSARQSAA